jgi:hypothetical protein
LSRVLGGFAEDVASGANDQPHLKVGGHDQRSSD